jgi:hypothetical protein
VVLGDGASQADGDLSVTRGRTILGRDGKSAHICRGTKRSGFSIESVHKASQYNAHRSLEKSRGFIRVHQRFSGLSVHKDSLLMLYATCHLE